MKRTATFCLLIICLAGLACQGTAAKERPAEGINPTAVPPAAAVVTLAPAPALAWTFTPLPSHTPTRKSSATVAPTNSPSPTNTLLPTIPSSYTPRPIASPTPRLAPALIPLITFSPTDFVDPANDLLHDVILFTSPDRNPFPGLRTENDYIMGENGTTSLWMFDQPLLWAVSPDGSRAGSLSCYLHPDCPLFAFYFSPDSSQQPKFVDYQVHANTDLFQQINLPPECYAWEPDPKWSREEGSACANFKFSPDGRYLGFYFGPVECYRGIMIMDTRAGDIIYRREASGHSFQFLENGKILIASGHCEGGSVSLFDPVTGALNSLGGEGQDIWHPAGIYLLEYSQAYMGVTASIWGYNLAADQVFVQDEGVINIMDEIAWTPGGDSVIYQKAEIIHSTQITMTVGAWQIMIAPLTGSPTILTPDPEHNYYLCPRTSNESCAWRGDWIPVQRLPANPQLYEYGEQPADMCHYGGIECPDTPELLALNYRTGELIPWEQFTPPAPTATPAPTSAPLRGPDLSRPPVYAHPAGTYAFYVGLDGASLWLVPQVGEPEQWVADGADFVYVP